MRKTLCLMPSEISLTVLEEDFVVISRYFLTTSIQCMAVIKKLMDDWKFIRKGLSTIPKLLPCKGV